MKLDIRSSEVNWANRRNMLGLCALMLFSGWRVAAGQHQQLQAHTPAAIKELSLKPIGPLPPTNRLHLVFALPWRNQGELKTLLQELYDPTNPNYRQYLTPEQFTERFGPSKADYESVLAFAKTHGLQVTGTSVNRLLVDVEGSVGQIERALHVPLNLYQHPAENRTFYAPAAEPAPDLATPLLYISGLDNFTLPHPLFKLKPENTNPIPAAGSGPGGGYMGADFRHAYAQNVPFTGTGQKVGLLEFDGYYPHDILAYESLAGLPSVTLSNVLLNGFNGAPGGANVEVALDIDMAIAMAPGLSEVIIYEGLNPDDVLNRMATDNLAKQLSSSWGWSPLDPIVLQIFQQFAAQGQSMYQASGDSDAYVGAVMPPSDAPYITVVGGTTLTMTSNGGAYVSETVWNWGSGIGSSGGISTRYAIPVWQQGIDMSRNQGSTTMRNLPDVAMTADNVFIFANGGQQINVGGTSCAAPLWAGFTALMNQAAAANHEPVVGFINPALYAFCKGSGYTANLHDITVGNNESPSSPTRFTAVSGYDLCTGWGTPIGSNLVYTIGVPEPLRVSPANDSLITGPVGGPFNPVILTYALTNKGSSPLNWSVNCNAAWLTVSPSSGTLLAGGPAAVLTLQPNVLASNLGPGLHLATLAFTNLNSQFGQLRQVTLGVATPPDISSQPVDQAVLQGMTATFQVVPKGYGVLYFQWQEFNGTTFTNLTDRSNISGSTTSTLTINNAGPANVGTYCVVVSNAAGTVVSAPAALTIVPSLPVIVSQPTNQTVLPGDAAHFNVVAVGNQPFTYRWQFNGSNLTDGRGIFGSATANLAVSNATTARVGAYSVLITNGLGSALSATAALNLVPVTAPGVTLDTLYSFTGTGLGFNPYAGLVQAFDGSLYGTALQGGSYGDGTVFKLSPAGSVSLLHALTGAGDGAFPYAALMQATGGLLYGTASGGGVHYDGTIFRLSTNGASSTLVSFTYALSGSFPVAGLLQTSDGGFYGTALEGGLSGYGTLFRATSLGAMAVLRAFNGDNGAFPSPVLVQGADGTLYGTAENGGTNGGWGTLFKATTGGVITPLLSFNGDNGGIPVAGLVQDTDGTLYGTTYRGGSNGLGTIFKLGQDGTFTSLYCFSGNDDGASPFAGLLLANDGNLYGAAESGGTYGSGTLFRISPQGTFAVLAQFDGFQGANPEGTLMQARDGSLYGTTANGGAGAEGAIFRISLNGALQITSQPQSQAAFLGDSVTFNVASFGSLPVAYQWLKNGTNLTDGGNISGSSSRSLNVANLDLPDDALYSVILSNSFGSVTSQVAHLTVMVSPPFIVSGPQPQTVLIGATVNLNVIAEGDAPLSFQWLKDGITLTNGGNISGATTPTLTMVSVTPANAGSYSVVVSNALAMTNSVPAALAIVPAVTPSGSYVLIHSFSATSLGFNPYAGLVQARDGYLYGTTLNGGSAGYGTTFRLGTGGIFVLLHSFTNGLDGANPFAGLVQGFDGNLYGGTFQGGAAFSGVLFKMSNAGFITPLYPFTGGDDGSSPVGTLVQGSDGYLYGTAYQGGADGYGSAFRVATNGASFAVLGSFSRTNGAYPIAPLFRAQNGLFYGTTYFGGSHDMGTVFSLSTNGVLRTLASLSYDNGAYPLGGLMQGADGALYGTTAGGGTNGGWGTIFRLTPGGTLTTLYSFGYADGGQPAAGLVLASDGTLLGTTSIGGIGDEGTVFRLTGDGALSTVLWFNGQYGANPQSPLIQARDGAFYGTAEYGGTAYNGAAGTGNGLVFRLTLPLFLNTVFTQGVAAVGMPFSGAITNVVRPPGAALLFAKASGPAWLNIATDGTLSGTPALADLGVNSFAVTLTDTNGWSSSASVKVVVVPAPLLLSLAAQGGQLLLNWSGGIPPYNVQMTPSLVPALWQTIAGPTNATSLLLTPATSSGFYRVQGQ